jgi:hypothetical protein
MTTLKSLAATLAWLGLLGIPALTAEETRHEEPGALEHYHHEYYSHSYVVNPNSRDSQDGMASPGLSKSKHGRSPGKPGATVSFALGGHRHHRRQE